jgi:hypothetical protein
VVNASPEPAKPIDAQDASWLRHCEWSVGHKQMANGIIKVEVSIAQFCQEQLKRRNAL